MVKKAVLISLMILSAVLACIMNNNASRMILKSQPDWYFLNLHSYRNFSELFSVSFGFRALAADMAYIQFLQYYGDKENAAARYKDLYQYLENITDIDPNFTFAYTYGAAILAFNLTRYDEAIRFISKGLRYNPAFWELRFYMGAIIYKQKGETLKYVGLLEDAIKFKDHPAILERMLGNIYEITKTPDRAALYWAGLYKTTKDKQSRNFAFNRIQEIIKQGKLKNPGAVVREAE